MNKQLTHLQRQFVVVLGLLTFFILGQTAVWAQTNPNGLLLSWDKEVGCETYGFEKERETFIEDIEDSDCIRVCEHSTVTYTLSNLPAGAVVTWGATGGAVTSASNSQCVVNWGASGTAALSFTMTTPTSVLNKTICIEKIIRPTAYFEIAPNNTSYPYYTCTHQDIHFVNLSTPNSGSSLVSYHWDFGDGNTSAAFEPSHAYAQDGDYAVTLTVRNSCNCIDVYRTKIEARRKGFEISCPMVICEGQTATYSLPFDGMQACNGNFNWSVIGGQIISQANGNVEVLWNAVDPSGFGYVTFHPNNCQLECLEPSTIKVPVIQMQGTIEGPLDLCLGAQGRYKLPRWPTTDIQWEIIGNGNNALAEIIQTDQRNEVVVTPFVSGTLTLRATYMNTLLHCGGVAEFVINVSKPLEITGDDAICQFESGVYTTTDQVSVNWVLTTSTGTVVTTSSGVNFNYTFNQTGQYVLSASGAGYCEGEAKVIQVVTQPGMPAGIDGDLFVCPNASYMYTVQSPNPDFEYYWEVTNGTIQGSDTGTQVNISFTGSFPATVAVYQRSISPIACTSAPRVINIQALPVAVELSNDFGIVCSNSVTNYEAFDAGTTNLYTDGDTYHWSLSDPLAGSISSGQGTNAIEVTWNNVTGVTTVDLILTVGKCTFSPAPQFVKTITINPQTLIAIQASQSTTCPGPSGAVTFTVQSTNGAPLQPTDQVTWNFGGADILGAPGNFSYTTTFTNNSGAAMDRIVMAYIANANLCGDSNTTATVITVLPVVPAVASLTSMFNAFCNLSDVDATIEVSSNVTGMTITWLKNGVPISPAQTGSTLQVGPSLGFGNYSFQVVNPNGCISVSNNVGIYQVCGPPPNCTINQTVTNTSFLSACGTITMVGGHTGTPITTSWNVLGPSVNDYTIVGNQLTGKPGNYKLIYRATYPCQEGGNGTLNAILDVVIPYEPDFSYSVSCTGNNLFDINLLDNSTFFGEVTNEQVDFYYKAVGAASFIGPLPYDPSLTVPEIQNLSAGNYIIRQEIQGLHTGTPTIVCVKEITINLEGIDPTIEIEINNAINCSDTPIQFTLSNAPPTGSTILWDFGDGSENTLFSPSKVYSVADTTYTVTCTITSPFGCIRVFTTSVYVPKECFFGDVVASPADATVCLGDAVTLMYVPAGDQCTVGQYVWMNGNAPVAGAANQNQLTVTDTGFYWVKLISTADCEYNTPTQIKPVFKTLPDVKYTGSTSFCENEPILLTAHTNAPGIDWAVGGVAYPQFAGMTTADFTGLLPVGSHNVTITVTSAAGCVNAISQAITIQEAIQSISFTYSISCSPNYEVTITATASNGSGVVYNWSNGENGATIVVADGGPYRVMASLGGCQLTAEIDIPKNPENYIWIFPSGCYEDCVTDLNYLIGPSLSLAAWSWNINNQIDVSGTGSFMTPYTLIKDGEYTMTINTGACALESDPLVYTMTRCERCKIEKVYVKEIVTNDTPYCSFTYTLDIYSGYNFPFTVSLSDDTNQVVIIPNTFVLQPGQNIVQVTVVPQSPFNGGALTWTLQGSIPVNGGFIDCIFEFDVDVPSCKDMPRGNTDDSSDANALMETERVFKMYPNPARTTVAVAYPLGLKGATAEIFDLTGRRIAQKLLSSVDQEVAFNTSAFPSGVYILVVKQTESILWQHKLIIE